MAASFLQLSCTPLLLIFCIHCFTLRYAYCDYSKAAFDVSINCSDIHNPESAAKLKPGSGANDSTLRVLVPWKVGFEQFVSFNPHSCRLDGFSVQVFRQAFHYKEPDSLLPPYKFVLLGNGSESPKYDTMIDMLLNETVDAVVADLTITKKRRAKVGFTVPYLASSLVVLTTFRYGSHGAFLGFLKPFSTELWIMLLVSFVATGFVLYLLEDENPEFAITSSKGQRESESRSHGASVTHTIASSAPKPTPTNTSLPFSQPTATQNSPPTQTSNLALDRCTPQLGLFENNIHNLDNEDVSSLQRPGPPIYDEVSRKRRAMNAYWFTSLCVFQSQQESVRTHVGRVITITWLFTMLIFNSSYTASLSSRLSAQQKYPTVKGFSDLKKDVNIPVGYQAGSFVPDFLKEHLHEGQLKVFNSDADFSQALKKGKLDPNGVKAIVDELPYIQVLLQSECNSFTLSSTSTDNLSTYGGFGFAFRKGDRLLDQMSEMILAMAEDGTLQKLQSGWNIGDHKGGGCDSNEEPPHLRLRSFGGLFSIVACTYAACIIWRLSYKVIKSQKGSCKTVDHMAVLTKPDDSTIEPSTRRLSQRWRSNRIAAVNMSFDN